MMDGGDKKSCHLIPIIKEVDKLTVATKKKAFTLRIFSGEV